MRCTLCGAHRGHQPGCLRDPYSATVKPPPAAMAAVQRVLSGDGASKYAGYDSGEVKDARTVQYHCLKALGHLLEDAKGVREDRDSGEDPLAHAAARLLLALERRLRDA